MGRKITMTGRNAQYVEHRAAGATPDDNREILMEGEEAVYREFAYGQAAARQDGSAAEQQDSMPACRDTDLTAAECDADDAAAERDAAPAAEVLLVDRLKPLFFNNEADVRMFLKEISGMPSGDITDLVNRWVQDKRISDYGNSRKGPLWEILNDAGLYTKSRQNWCRRVY